MSALMFKAQWNTPRIVAFMTLLMRGHSLVFVLLPTIHDISQVFLARQAFNPLVQELGEEVAPSLENVVGEPLLFFYDCHWSF